MPAGWVERLGLQAHPEGGWFRRIHTAAASENTDVGLRHRFSSIHYLLDRDRPQGCFHRNRSTILHYLQHGGPVEYLLLADDGSGMRRHRLAFDAAGELFLAVPGGVWKASRLIEGASHALVSEVVIPGFDPQDHEFLSEALAAERFAPWMQWIQPLLRAEGPCG